MLSLAGFDVVGPFMSSRSAEALIDSEDIGAALLDVNLGDETSFSLAAKLKARGIPFAFVTGYNLEDLPADAQTSPLLNKPVPEGALTDVVKHLLTA